MDYDDAVDEPIWKGLCLLVETAVPANTKEECSPSFAKKSSCFSRLSSSPRLLPNPSCSALSQSTAVYKKREMKNPPSPSSESSLPSRVMKKEHKRPASKEKKSSSRKLKKAKVVHLSWKGENTPELLYKMMRSMSVFEQPKLIFERGLYATDVNSSESRLSMPINQIICNDFLTLEEAKILEEDIEIEKKRGFRVIVVDKECRQFGLYLKRWETKGSWNYTLTCGWNQIVVANGFKEDDGISVWTFRWRGILCFALVPPPLKQETK